MDEFSQERSNVSITNQTSESKREQMLRRANCDLREQLYAEMARFEELKRTSEDQYQKALNDFEQEKKNYAK